MCPPLSSLLDVEKNFPESIRAQCFLVEKKSLKNDSEIKGGEAGLTIFVNDCHKGCEKWV